MGYFEPLAVICSIVICENYVKLSLQSYPNMRAEAQHLYFTTPEQLCFHYSDKEEQRDRTKAGQTKMFNWDVQVCSIFILK